MTAEEEEFLEYEALVEKKRKAFSNGDCEGPRKKCNTKYDEMIESMMGARRRSRKLERRGRPKGFKNKLRPEIRRMLGEATLHYVHAHYKEAISVLESVIVLHPCLPDTYHTLGLVYDALGNTEKAVGFYELAAEVNPKDSTLWKLLCAYFVERRNTAKVKKCLRQAVRADPNDITLRFHLASLYVELGDYWRAAECYGDIVQLCPDNVEAIKTGAKLYVKSCQIESSVGILEDYLKDHPSEADFGIIDLLASILMEINAFDKALKHIEHAHLVYYSDEELPLELKIRAGICHIHLGNMEKAEIILSIIRQESVSAHVELITEVADASKYFEYFNCALKYYHMLEANDEVHNGCLHLKIAQCYLSLKEREKGIKFYYKALLTLEDDVDTRLTLASLLLEDAKDEEAISLLTPSENLGNIYVNSDNHDAWWLNKRIKMKLCDIYRGKGMLEHFVDMLLPLVRESLWQKVKFDQGLSGSVPNICEKGDDKQTNNICDGQGLVALTSVTAKQLPQIEATSKQGNKAVVEAAEVAQHVTDSDDKFPQEAVGCEEHHHLIMNLCKALVSLQRYQEAVEIINLTRKSDYNKFPIEKKEELESLGAQISSNTMDHPEWSFDSVRFMVKQYPYHLTAWNCYYKLTRRLEKGYSKHAKFLRDMRVKYKDCIPPIIISGHQFTATSHHQDAAREYLEAYKLSPENPLINLCVGTALINLALGLRLQNKHQCLTQGLAFLYNNLQLGENNQEALYNIGRAYHHIGLVSLAASYYEKVLQTYQKDYAVLQHPNKSQDQMEDWKPGHCELRKEAAYNLHLIYKRSGAFDLARQVLKDHCSFG